MKHEELQNSVKIQNEDLHIVKGQTEMDLDALFLTPPSLTHAQMKHSTIPSINT